ncbi:hypothetical protein [Hymenobacter armeniacus]|uniref:DNA-directed RNA polymerase n=1 Tax=Hymenobacter armeniacus TaxID=2771358 RepID=A0ABR8JP32_9BACT|nr:hypothetical protein [Hymenobacter armeniacus]MBD2720815.1 hypothetical protein [Hymenobacter armeniacus]
MKLFQFLVPSKIDIALILTSVGHPNRYIHDHIDKYHYILHKILQGRVLNREIGTDGYTQLHLRTLEEFLGGRYANPILKEMVKLGLIQCDYYYIEGVKSFGYRIAPEYVSKAVAIDIFKMETMVRKLNLQSAAYKRKRTKDPTWKNLTQLSIRYREAVAFIDSKLDASLARLATHSKQLAIAIPPLVQAANKKDVTLEQLLDDHEATHVAQCNGLSPIQEVISIYQSFLSRWKYFSGIDAGVPCYEHSLTVKDARRSFYNPYNQGLTLYDLLESSFLSQYNSDLASLKNINDESYFLEQPDADSRVYTNISNLSRDLRGFLYLRKAKTTPLVNCDIRNSQPYLFSLLLMEEYDGEELPEDVRYYIELTAGGNFYEHMMGLLDVPTEERDNFKKLFFGTIFFCTSYYSKRTPEGKMFGKHFPNVYSLVNEYKADSHSDLAVHMQQAEAGIMLKTIGVELTGQNIWFTSIHDSIVVMEKHVEHVKHLILEAFMAKVGIPPTVTEEWLTTVF